MTALLSLRGVTAHYGASQALFGIDLDIAPGEFVTLLGRNGMGKSTTVKAVMGLNSASRGAITFDGVDIGRLPSYKVAQRGIGLVPEGRHVFPNLSVRENLVATAHNRQGAAQPWTLERVYALFPRLSERAKHLGSHLSGGEQQMLAIGRALLTNPRLLILDEATEGLAPVVREEIWAALDTLKQTGLAVLCIDKNLEPLLATADRHAIVEKGRVAWTGTSQEFLDDEARLLQYLGV
ncbi:MULTISPECIES: ABC transporter ATP-binding protein [Achromobacter]|uniref:High-affinity branched-chain amino acid transport ATP-binding protein LivF n=1 Tax=Achromobacter animicus TaxID=1389935 RepID=A0A6S7AAA5_9BURK|nr:MULTISPECIES: ABC transporter ATP-binding protein [Achromobacter]MCG7324115.1 ABC transporter ATP-binding protein [Achromobacter sp. ACRQX]CAB3681369.1 High-affinity branched-chain amino acid transport ATP-binding protein LivF [Achromobacter animicus]CAB3853902.1 High-affinity branched-chain amino acid transport ATP-binding protein LivF [Achromobacter animicus]